MPPKRARAASDAAPPAPPATTTTTRRSTRVSAQAASASAVAASIAPVPTASSSQPPPAKRGRKPKVKDPEPEPEPEDDDEPEEEPEEPKKPAKRGASKKTKEPEQKRKLWDVKPADPVPAPEPEEEEEEEEEEPEPEPEVIVKSIKKGVAAVDSGVPSSLAQSYHVLQKDGVVYDALLNQTDIGNNNNKYYIIQVLKHDTKELYIAWNRWGRVGNNGQSSQPEFFNANAAISAFEKKFADKTKNKWANRDDFVKYPGKYFLLERDWGEDDTEEALKSAGANEVDKNEPIQYPDSKLEPAVQDLVKLIFNLDLMEKEMTEIGYDAKKMPLGKLTKKTIQLGYLELKKISEELSRVGGPRSAVLKTLSSDFYTIIPHNFGRNVPDIINTPVKLNAKLRMVEALGDIQITTTLLNTKLDRSKNPVDGKYESLKVDLRPVDKNGDTFKLVEKYTANTHGHTHSSYKLKVQEVFELDKEDKFDEVGKTLHNKKLLWHGSRITNYVGILSQGLRIAPPEAPVTGYMFGKGVYFADMVSKSANYCCTSRDNPTGLLLLCEVALGDENQLINANYDADKDTKSKSKHSTWGLGRTKPNPAEYVTLSDGVVVPCGKGVRTDDGSAYLEYNEFICYDVRQVRLKYLVKMEFDYKGGY
ncbi:UNVERIFIED_CONTAM: Poly [ADP-ribose] polymerase 2 [Siphonaria sp. JEL0065]|nr:Poly [ADP-ribose] polymerase 2 [Siphonaria sp. JEL0065]